MRFILQSDPDVSTVERNAVRHAAMLDDDIDAGKRLPMSALTDVPAGSMADERARCPVGSVEFCRAWMRATGVSEPPPLDYPPVLLEALQRPMTLCPMADAPVGSWIKPVQTKAWNARIRTDEDAGGELVWWTPYIPEEQWQAEWRVYVTDGRIVAAARYDDHEPEDPVFDRGAVEHWLRLLEAEGQRPAGFALDVGLLRDRTVLVEVTDGWAIGCYRGIRPAEYARLLWLRWTELATEGRVR